MTYECKREKNVDKIHKYIEMFEKGGIEKGVKRRERNKYRGKMREKFSRLMKRK